MSEKQRAGRANAPAPSGPEMTRRNFLKLGVQTLGALALLEMGFAGLSYMQPRSLEGEFGGVVSAGPADSFPPGSVTEFPAGRFFLVRGEDGGFLALYKKCTHLGCAVSWQAQENRFACPCHGSYFDAQGGVENPPAPRALDAFAIRIENGELLVDTAKALSRDRFSPDQVVYA